MLSKTIFLHTYTLTLFICPILLLRMHCACFILEEIYCASCYGKQFGPKGYGYGGGAGVLSMDAGKSESGPRWGTSNVPSDSAHHGSSFGSGPKCPRCGKTVYEAEKVIGAGEVINLISFMNFV